MVCASRYRWFEQNAVNVRESSELSLMIPERIAGNENEEGATIGPLYRFGWQINNNALVNVFIEGIGDAKINWAALCVRRLVCGSSLPGRIDDRLTPGSPRFPRGLAAYSNLVRFLCSSHSPPPRNLRNRGGSRVIPNEEKEKEWRYCHRNNSKNYGMTSR
ncbi:MAG: hypothetical protein QW652_07095 [Candidatus Nitrosotenuis sp.]